ncbi:MAG: metal ABC transporter ATP-binding protein [Candidatus Eremiobacteraeota bacterium]|nr:metal ABC transporter ATP-binding protein [Candidatus Eremiobacteraeota bacterium]
MSSESEVAVRTAGLSVHYGRIAALENVDFVVTKGSALGIVGPNGSGKSTLLKTIAGLKAPSSGTIEVFGASPRALAPGTIAYVPQVEAVDWTFPANVYDVVAMGRFPRLRALARFSRRDREVVNEALDALRIGDLRDRHISQLSGGQQQRAFVARAVAQEPGLLLLDEPTTGVDAATEDALLALVRRLVAGGLPVVMTTHDLERAGEWFDRLMVLDRRILAIGDPDDVLASGAYAGIREHVHTHGHLRSDRAAEHS